MEYGNGRARMIELDKVYVLYLPDFLSKGSRESFKQHILFGLSPQSQAARLAGKTPGLARPSFVSYRKGRAGGLAIQSAIGTLGTTRIFQS